MLGEGGEAGISYERVVLGIRLCMYHLRASLGLAATDVRDIIGCAKCSGKA